MKPNKIPSDQKYESLISAALSLKDAGENQKAINILDDAVNLFPERAAAFILLGLTYQLESDFESAETNFRKALELEPDNPEVLQGLGLFLVFRKRFAEAVPYLEKHLKLIPDDFQSLNGVIKALSKLGNRKQDIFEFAQNAWLHSNNPDIGMRYGQLLIKNKEPQKAYDVLQQVVEIKRSSDTLSSLANVCRELKKIEQAIELLQEACKLNPKEPLLKWQLASIYLKQFQYDKALEAIEQALLLKPRDPFFWWFKSMILFQQKNFDESIRTADHAIKLVEKSDEIKLESKKSLKSLILFIKIGSLMATKKYLKAMNEFRKAVSKNLDISLIQPAMAKSLIDEDKKDLAREVMSSGSSEKDFFELSSEYDIFLRGLNEPEKARALILSALTSQDSQVIKKVFELGVEEYLAGHHHSAIEIYTMLNDHRPENLQACNNLGYMLIGENEKDRAKELLNKAIKGENKEVFPLIARCNLAYLYALTAEYDRINPLLEEVLNEEISKEGATLRIPFWIDGKMKPDPAQFPGRDISLETAALGCAITIALAKGEIRKAESLLVELKKEADELLGWLIEGCMEAEKNNNTKAKTLWAKAIEKSKNEEEKKTIREWMDLIDRENHQ